MPHINPNTSNIATALATRICEAIAADEALYNHPDNAAVVPEALLTVLASTIATRFQRKGHSELVRLSAEKLADLVEQAYVVHRLFAAVEEAGRSVSDPAHAPDDPLSGLEQELVKIMDALFPADAAKH